MSYEGYEEFLCENGHYYTAACAFESESTAKCPHCKKKTKWWNAVDQTNGMDEDVPATMSAPKKEIGFDDKWKEDHYGNKYAVKILKFEPDSDRWRKFVPFVQDWQNDVDPENIYGSDSIRQSIEEDRK